MTIHAWVILLRWLTAQGSAILASRSANHVTKRPGYRASYLRQYRAGCRDKIRAQARALYRKRRERLGLPKRSAMPSEERRNRKRVWALEYWRRTRGTAKRRRRSLELAYRVAMARPRARGPALARAFRRVLKRRHSAVDAKLALRLRRRFEKAFGCEIKSDVIMNLTGTSLAHLRAHLESLWKPGMTWSNYGFYGWHIDHIRPLSSFNLQDPVQTAIAFHWKNLQPLWMKENLSKGKKFPISVPCVTLPPC